LDSTGIEPRPSRGEVNLTWVGEVGVVGESGKILLLGEEEPENTEGRQKAN
jgi:hypothetical protein